MISKIDAHEEKLLKHPISALDISLAKIGVVIKAIPLNKKLHIVYQSPAFATTSGALTVSLDSRPIFENLSGIIDILLIFLIFSCFQIAVIPNSQACPISWDRPIRQRY